MGWKLVVLTRQDVKIDGPLHRLREEFFARFLAAGRPEGAGIYVPRGYLHGKQYHYYFSPEAVTLAPALIETIGATDCPEPDTTQLEPFLGADVPHSR